MKRNYKSLLKWILLAAFGIIASFLVFLSISYRDNTYAVIGIALFMTVFILTIEKEIVDKRISLPLLRSLKLPHITRILRREKHLLDEQIAQDSYKLKLKGRWRNFILLFSVYFLLNSALTYYLSLSLLNKPDFLDLNKPIVFSYLITVWHKSSILWAYEALPFVVFLLFSLYLLFFAARSVKRTIIRPFMLLGHLLIFIFVFTLLYLGSLYTALEYQKFTIHNESIQLSSKLQEGKDLKIFGIVSNAKEINDKLKRLNKTPTVIGDSPDLRRKIILSILQQKSNNGSFYKEVLLPSSVSADSLDFKLAADIVLLQDNTLVIAKINKETIETITPSLSRLIVSSYFDPKYVKEESIVTVMGRQEYLKFREDQINEQIEKIGLLITEAQRYINNNYANINEARNKIQTNKDGIDRSIAARNENYNYCKSAGYYSYYFGTFYRYYTDAECESQKQRWDSIIAGFQKNVADWEQTLKDSQYYLAENQKIKETLVSYQELIRSQKDVTPNELGLFEPPNLIKVVLESTSDKAIADYLAIAIHEFLHYTSYVSEERSLPQFFEEGLTEYYTRKIISNQLKSKTNVGYPVIVRIIQKMAQDVSEDELIRIYFTKDEKTLIAYLNDKYGSNFYKDSQYYFEILPWVSGKESLTIANNILFKIDGEPLEEEDLYSTESSF